MRRILFSTVLSATLALTAQADLLRVEAGAGAFIAEPSGTLSYEDDIGSVNVDATDNLGYGKESLPYVWLNVKHPIPIVPNLRLEYLDVNFKGKSKKVTWGTNDDGAAVTVPDGTTSELSLTQYDAVLYYNLLDNTFWTTIDLGLDVKFIEGSYTIDANSVGSIDYPGYDESFSAAIPMGYLRGRVQIPATGLGVEGDIKYIAYSDSELMDARIKADWTMEFVPVIQPGIEVGYRVQKVNIDESDYSTKVDVDFSGAYVGLMLRF
jgi:outer membrane protein